MNRSRITGDLVSQNNIFVNTANDRVGIGSTIPTNKLDVRGIIESRSATNFHEGLWTGENTKIQLQAGYLHIQGGSNGTINNPNMNHLNIMYSGESDISWVNLYMFLTNEKPNFLSKKVKKVMKPNNNVVIKIIKINMFLFMKSSIIFKIY